MTRYTLVALLSGLLLIAGAWATWCAVWAERAARLGQHHHQRGAQRADRR